MQYLEGFFETSRKKLFRIQAFVENLLKKVVEIERKKQNDARQKLSLCNKNGKFGLKLIHIRIRVSKH